MWEWEHAHKDILKQGINVVCIIKFEYKSITHSRFLGKDYSLPSPYISIIFLGSLNLQITKTFIVLAAPWVQ